MLQHFTEVEVLEHYNTYFKLRVQREGKSIGFLFGLIESSKTEAGVTEYSVSQTTLEQIFQYFANEDVEEKVNTAFKRQEGGGMVKK